MDNLSDLVKQAKRGDDEAFGLLIGRFQNFAYATAYRYLGERMLAQDAAQEAFWETYHQLHRLREPHAFPAWLRRIVYKQCDRLTRGKRPDLQPLTERLPSHAEHPDYVLEQMQLRVAIELAIDQLPPIYRAAARPFYLHNRSLREVADALDLSIGTVKKRLFTARHKLRETLMNETTYQPSQDSVFSDRVRFAIALKKGDLTTIRQLLNRSTEHLTTYSEWGQGAYSWYYPLGQWPIHWAAGTGDIALAELLIEFGADVNSADKLNRTPILLAAHMGQADMLNWLFAKNADPNVPMQNGQTALHIATIDKRAAIVAQLLTNGADIAAKDANGCTALDWAMLNEDDVIAKQLQAAGAAAQITMPPARLQPVATTILETGIKIIDLIAPLKWGGINGEFGLVGGVGFDMMMAELMYRFANFHKGHVVQIGLERGEFTERSRLLQWRNMGVEAYVELFFGKLIDSTARRLHLLDRALKRVGELADDQPVLLTMYSDVALTDGALERIKAMAGGNVTVLITANEAIWAEPAGLEKLDSAFAFSGPRAKLGLWPAIDLLRSYAVEFESAEHAAIAKASRRTWALYAEMRGPYEKMGAAMFERPFIEERHRQAVIRARRLDRFLSQPLFVAQSFVGKSAEFIPLAHTLEITQAILNGEMDDVPEDDLTFINQWKPAWF